MINAETAACPKRQAAFIIAVRGAAARSYWQIERKAAARIARLDYILKDKDGTVNKTFPRWC